MTQYLLSAPIGPRSPIPPDDETAAVYAAVDAFDDEVRTAGRWVFAACRGPVEVRRFEDEPV
jgi:hypothetical protein